MTKIAASEWPKIVARHRAGESLARIGRTYNCTPPAILYIVRKNQRGAGETPRIARSRTSVPRDQWASVYARHKSGDAIAVLAQSLDCSPRTISRIIQAERHLENSPGARRKGAQGWKAVGPGSGAATGFSRKASVEPSAADRAMAASHPGFEGHRASQQTGGEQNAGGARSATREGQSARSAQLTKASADVGTPLPGEGVGREGGAARDNMINERVRERITSDVAAFLTAFNAVLERDIPENRSALLRASDRLLRAGANTRSEIERLEELGANRQVS